MEKKWNLQDIKPSSQKRSSRSTERLSDRAKSEKVEPKSSTRTTVSTNKKGGKGLATLALAGILLIAGVLGASFLLEETEITVNPRHREPTVNATLTAYSSPQVGELSYELMVLEADGERQVSATGQEPVSEQATGNITIYNETDRTERLIKNTRFESPEGLVFRIAESAVVPAASTDDSGQIVPGSVKAQVFADNAGEEYNLNPTSFTVPGYRENGFTELYENIYAESQESFRGGFDGMKFIIDEEELEASKNSLHEELREALLSRVDQERPAGFVVFDSATVFTYESQPSVESGDNMATIKEKAVLQIPIFAEDEFASYLAAATIPGYEGEPVRIENTEDLTFTYSNSTSTEIDLRGANSIDFRLNGKPQIIWAYDTEKLKNDLAGAPKTALTTILGAYPAIEKAEAVVRPFWKRSFSSDVSDIEIIESLSE